ncbi:MAG: anti-sigma regulatory factor (Ser/Thr protein kinase) [Pseudohongiellaceae bacterium]|jgi:anti-sigma regulatory factor (Ser/Thr protein kinase)
MRAGTSVHRTLMIDGSAAPVRGLRAMVGSFLDDRCIDTHVRRAVVLAFSEALDNAVEHGMVDSQGSVTLWLRYSPHYILVALRDPGSDQVPLGHAQSVNDDAERGRGFELMHKLMDLVKVHNFPHGGTRVAMLRRLDGRPCD